MASILIIDDDELSLMLLTSIVEEMGHQATQAADGEKGLEAYGSGAFDLVITDLLMPRKEGLETIADIRKLNPDQKIIAVSTGGDEVRSGLYLDTASKFGANATLQKPFSRDEVQVALKGVLGPDGTSS